MVVVVVAVSDVVVVSDFELSASDVLEPLPQAEKHVAAIIIDIINDTFFIVFLLFNVMLRTPDDLYSI